MTTTLTAATTNEIDQAARYAAENAASRERFARRCTLDTLENGAGQIVMFRRMGAAFESNLAAATAAFQKALREANDRFEGMTESKKYIKAAAQAAELGIEF
jgi:hypothetical protein